METMLLVITLISVATAIVALDVGAPRCGAASASARKRASPRWRQPPTRTAPATAAGRRSPANGSGRPNR